MLHFLQDLALEIAVNQCRRHPLLIDISEATLSRLLRQAIRCSGRTNLINVQMKTWSSYAKRFPAWLEAFEGTSDIYDQSIRATVQLSLDALDSEARSLLLALPVPIFDQVCCTDLRLYTQCFELFLLVKPHSWCCCREKCGTYGSGLNCRICRKTCITHSSVAASMLNEGEQHRYV